MKTALIVWVLLSAPASLAVIGWGLILILEATNLGVFAACCAVIVTGVLAIASLTDRR